MFFAYLDPGSGSLILQAVLGGIAGIAVAFKAWRARFAGGRVTEPENEHDGSPDEEALTTEP